MLAYMHAQNAYFHQGSDLFADLEPYMKNIASQVRIPFMPFIKGTVTFKSPMFINLGNTNTYMYFLLIIIFPTFE